MKKILAILLSLALLLGCSACLAEEKQSYGTIRVNGEFTLKGILAEGYQIIPIEISDDAILIRIVSDDPTRPTMLLSIAYDESYSNVDRLNDLDNDALAILEKTFTDTDPYAEITYDETAYGTRLLLCRTRSETYDSLDIFSIYKGYFVEFVMIPGEGAPVQRLTEEAVKSCIEFLSELDFVEGAEEAAMRAEGMTFTAKINGFDAEAKTIDVSLLTPVVLTEWDIGEIKEGGAIRIGTDDVEISTLSRDGDDIVINDEYYLRKNEGGQYNPYFYDSPLLQEVKAMTIAVPDSLVFTENIDPLSGEMLEEEQTLTAADLFAALEAAKDDGVGFDSENVSVSFDENGAAVQIERFYAPWQ